MQNRAGPAKHGCLPPSGAERRQALLEGKRSQLSLAIVNLLLPLAGQYENLGKYRQRKHLLHLKVKVNSFSSGKRAGFCSPSKAAGVKGIEAPSTPAQSPSAKALRRAWNQPAGYLGRRTNLVSLGILFSLRCFWILFLLFVCLFLWFLVCFARERRREWWYDV